MLKKLRGFNLGLFFAIKVAPQNAKKNCPLVSRKKIKFSKLKLQKINFFRQFNGQFFREFLGATLIANNCPKLNPLMFLITKSKSTFIFASIDNKFVQI